MILLSLLVVVALLIVRLLLVVRLLVVLTGIPLRLLSSWIRAAPLLLLLTHMYPQNHTLHSL